jgi:type II secretory pathway pseudopilin PulG
MQESSQKNKALSWAMSLVEVIMALVIVSIMFATLVQQFRPAKNSWASKRTNTEILQNAGTLMNHMTSNLNQAAKITAVSGPDETPGYIEFVDNDSAQGWLGGNIKCPTINSAIGKEAGYENEAKK